jgi:hypothetical protein
VQRKNVSYNVSTHQTFVDYCIIYSPGVAGVLLAASMVYANRMWRKWAMVLFSAAMSASLFAFVSADSHWKQVGVNACEYFFQ